MPGTSIILVHHCRVIGYSTYMISIDNTRRKFLFVRFFLETRLTQVFQPASQPLHTSQVRSVRRVHDNCVLLRPGLQWTRKTHASQHIRSPQDGHGWDRWVQRLNFAPAQIPSFHPALVLRARRLGRTHTMEVKCPPTSLFGLSSFARPANEASSTKQRYPIREGLEALVTSLLWRHSQIAPSYRLHQYPSPAGNIPSRRLIRRVGSSTLCKCGTIQAYDSNFSPLERTEEKPASKRLAMHRVFHPYKSSYI